MPLGAGRAPAGGSYAGYGSPDHTTLPSTTLLPDPNTGIAQQGRYLDPFKKDYAFTADGRIEGMTQVNQLVQLALTTVLGSSAVPTLGNAFLTIQEQAPNFPSQIEKAVRDALADLVRRKLVNVVSVDVNTLPSNPDAGWGTVRWQDLTNNNQVVTTRI